MKNLELAVAVISGKKQRHFKCNDFQSYPNYVIITINNAQTFPVPQDNKPDSKNVRLLHPSLNSHSFAVKNDNIPNFFAVLVVDVEFAGFAPKQVIHCLGRFLLFPRIRSVLQNPDRETTNQSA